MSVREGLARLEDVESISERCNRQAGTGELRSKQGRLLDPDKLARDLADIRVGARLRGVEATVEGVLERERGKAVLRVGRSNVTLQLAPLTTKVQSDALKTKKPSPATGEEKQAYKTLLSRIKSEALPVRVTGPLRRGLKLEVRHFELK